MLIHNKNINKIALGLPKNALFSALSNQKEINPSYALKTINQTAQNVIVNLELVLNFCFNF